MSFINITTNNLSRQLRNAATYIDNWVYVPGTAITGDWKQTYAFRSLEEFQKVCGTRGPEGSITYEYVAGLLSAGLPVLFRRIAYKNQDNITEQDIADGTAEGVTRAKTIISHDGAEGKVNDLEITEKYGGSFGSELSITLKPSSNVWYLEVYHKASLLEKIRVVTIPNSIDDPVEINKLLMDGLKHVNSERVNVNVLVEDKNAASFHLEPITNRPLTGGEDIDDGLVAAEIPASLDFIKDKILYQPKFLTSGGYVDTDIESGVTPIADKLKEISKIRQDCRALIDLPIGTPADKQQDLAVTIAYQQNSSTEVIPSASTCAPWCYMQVGNEQLWMPPSYVYLTVVGSALSKGGKAYTPKAGLSSGIITNIIKPEFEIGSDRSSEWQSDTKVNLNPIMRLQSGNYVIAGNSTLLMPDVDGMEINAFAESSADLTIIEIRRFVYNLATELQYQYNSTEAFETFSLRAAKFFEAMISEGAMSNYEISNISTDEDPRTLKLQIDVYLTPTIKKIEIFLNVAYGSVEVSTGGVE